MPSGKQGFVYLHRRLMPSPSTELYTASTNRATLQTDKEFRFDGKACGKWSFTGDKLLILQFRARCYGNGEPLNHIFMETVTKDCWRLVAASDPMYKHLAGNPHNNNDTEIVLLMKIPDEIEYADRVADEETQ